MDGLREALMDDWQGHRKLLKVAEKAPKWGNDDDCVDDVFLDLYDYYCEAVRKQTNYLGSKYDPSMLAISTHGPFGRACLASPDGRKAGEPLADGVTSPYPGTDTEGPFAVLCSAGKVDHTQIRGGLMNMKFTPASLKGVSGSHNLLALVRSYFETNGFQIQFNVVNSDMLRDAQKHPDQYRSLIVRVAGFSAYFVELGKVIQDEVIQRTEHTL
jgi:formate C-acetyltransferase/4-hydroxyphenylacetate decarboxylase large subunit